MLCNLPRIKVNASWEFMPLKPSKNSRILEVFAESAWLTTGSGIAMAGLDLDVLRLLDSVFSCAPCPAISFLTPFLSFCCSSSFSLSMVRSFLVFFSVTSRCSTGSCSSWFLCCFLETLLSVFFSILLFRVFADVLACGLLWFGFAVCSASWYCSSSYVATCASHQAKLSQAHAFPSHPSSQPWLHASSVPQAAQSSFVVLARLFLGLLALACLLSSCLFSSSWSATPLPRPRPPRPLPFPLPRPGFGLSAGISAGCCGFSSSNRPCFILSWSSREVVASAGSWHHKLSVKKRSNISNINRVLKQRFSDTSVKSSLNEHKPTE